jgi:DNA-binding response OmpR family regulator
MNSSKHVLLIDDDPKFRAMMICALQDMGCALSQAASLHEANIELDLGSFDLIVLDGALPDGDGLTWLKELRQRNCQTPVVFISGLIRDSASFKQLSRELRVCLVLQKPLLIKVFREEIGRVINCEPEHASNVNEDASAAIDLLTEEFTEELPSRVDQLSRVIKKASEPPYDPAVLKAAMGEAHMLRGTSGIFGFIEVGQCMGWIEDALKVMLRDSRLLSSPKGWATVMFALQVAKESAHDAAAAPTQQQVSNQAPVAKQPPVGARARVLLFDDDRHFAKRVEAVFSAEGILVYSFLDTECISEVMEGVSPSLVLIDLNMPDSDGLEICRVIRSDRRYNDIPIVFISSTVSPESRAAAMKAGANGFLSKSLVNTELLDEVRSYLMGALVACKSA